MSDETEDPKEPEEPEVPDPDAVVHVRSMTKREVDVRIVPWDVPIQTVQGLEMFARGAFEGTDPNRVLLMGMEHEAHLGLGQAGAPRLVRRPIGKGRSIEDRKDGSHMTFRVAPTPAGDEFLTLASEGIVDGVSMEFDDVPGGTESQVINGRRVNLQRRVRLNAVSPTYQPAYAEARVLAVRSQEEAAVAEQEQAAPAAEEPTAPPAPSYDFSGFERAVGAMNSGITSLSERMEKMEERYRSSFEVPAPHTDDVPEANWIQTNPEKGWFTYFRWYSPTRAFFDRSWKMGNILEVK